MDEIVSSQERATSEVTVGVNKGVMDHLAQSFFMECLGPKFSCGVEGGRGHGEGKCE